MTNAPTDKTIADEFREFALKGNVVDMAVGIIIGGAFGAIVTSLVNDVLMPPIGVLLGGVDFRARFWVLSEGTPVSPYETVEAAQAAGAATLNWGLFLNSVVSFLIVAVAVFFLVKAVNRLRRIEPQPKTTLDCPRCVSEIPQAATRCPHCTSELTPPAEAAAP